ncbi:MAG: alginate export family protein [Leptospiraceae bacterium]|nr:alginate export family protein [Leptospiraceae bacterium]
MHLPLIRVTLLIILETRTGFFFGYVSGDRNPLDNTNQRFERLFGFARPCRVMTISNGKLEILKLVLEFEPIKGLKARYRCRLVFLGKCQRQVEW